MHQHGKTAAGGAYPQHARAKVNRYRNRATYDYTFVNKTINTARTLHVAFPPSAANNDPFPALLPMIGVMARYDEDDADADTEPGGDDEPLDLYLHGYVSSRLMRLGAAAEKGEGAEAEEQGLPVTIEATIVDGLVLSLTPNSHSYNYRSAVVHGYATPVTNPTEKIWAMRQVTNNVVSHRWENTRTPPTPLELQTTQILRVRVVSASGKARKGVPHDDKVDVANGELTSKVWTGVLPIVERVEGAVSLGDGAREVPAYVREYVDKANKDAIVGAGEGMREPGGEQVQWVGEKENKGWWAWLSGDK